MILTGKVALVTGGARGLGKAIAATFLGEGCKVAICDLDETILQQTVSEFEKDFGQQIKGFRADVTDPASVEQLITDVENTWDSVDILVNNAGITQDSLLLRMTQAQWQKVMDVNLTGVFNCSKAVLRGMIKRRYGRIINISSVVGRMGNAGQANYAASKAGVIGFTKSLAREVASRGITANAIAPGFIESAMTEQLNEEQKKRLTDQIPMQRTGQAVDVANAVLFFASDLSAYVTGQVLNVDGGLLMN
ncbi:MAG: 3-oxoacyl-[acyl-carrier-protein] reductase [Limnochordia bacterium]|jgi:3-oxoacyl-[acyl-carrier protein] reductase|nr:3-oxoacyl-[acyl-carrier-protein] reductase [Limnochordia bacterium]MDD4516888.1 3-oxoacyl-[acyl-carrier-protein] reductase [Limnochordia bacterium]